MTFVLRLLGIPLGLVCFVQAVMPIEVPDLPSTSRATMYRTANASEVLDRLYEEVCATRDSDRAVFCPSALDIIPGFWNLPFLN